jgi:CheY-like chemotaxis protein
VKRVLVVDDEFGLVEALADVLSDAGYTVSSARNGKDALKRIAEGVPDLVLMDYMMPVMDGPALLAAMRAEAATRATPVVLMTSVQRANVPRELDVQEVLQKPFKIDALLQVVKKLVG